MKKIFITISPIGLPTIDAVGFSGTECVTATDPYVTLAGKVKETVEKPEMQELQHDDYQYETE